MSFYDPLLIVILRTDPANAAVIEASDFIGTNAFPFFQGVDISDANATFWSSIASVQAAATAVKANATVWITETGWPVSVGNESNALASIENAQSYWNTTACSAFESMNTFWYAYQDWNSTWSFGAFGSNNTNEYVSAC